MKVYNIITISCEADTRYEPEASVSTFVTKEKAIAEYNEQLEWFKDHYDEESFEIISDTEFVIVDDGDDAYIEVRFEESEAE